MAFDFIAIMCMYFYSGLSYMVLEISFPISTSLPKTHALSIRFINVHSTGKTETEAL